jgi:hypothetical protein
MKWRLFNRWQQNVHYSEENYWLDIIWYFFLMFMGLCIVIIFYYIANKMQRYTVYFIRKLLYMFQVVPAPIIRGANNCIYSIWYLSQPYCYLPLTLHLVGYILEYDMIYLTAIGLPPGGSSTVHIYTQTIHRTIQSTQTMHRTTHFTEQHSS